MARTRHGILPRFSRTNCAERMWGVEGARFSDLGQLFAAREAPGQVEGPSAFALRCGGQLLTTPWTTPNEGAA